MPIYGMLLYAYMCSVWALVKTGIFFLKELPFVIYGLRAEI